MAINLFRRLASGTSYSAMSASNYNAKLLQKIFLNGGVASVNPLQLLTKETINFATKNNREQLNITDAHSKTYTFDTNEHNFHIIGFGKAVFSMAVAMERVLGNKLKSGILSVPVGTKKQFEGNTTVNLKNDSVIKVFEGAKNNLPDGAAIENAERIVQKCREMTKQDVLLVLVSGGGSALLPLPIPPITLDEKLQLIKELTANGATIQQLNTVRIALSNTKGGKLAIEAKNAGQVIGLIVSDIVGDEVDLIASGPTTLCNETDNKKAAQDILNSYGIKPTANIVDVLTVRDVKETAGEVSFHKNIENVLIGNNIIAVNGCIKKAHTTNYSPILLSTTIIGNVDDLCDNYIKLCLILKDFALKLISKSQVREKLLELKTHLSFDQTFLDALDNQLVSKNILLVASGEPTVVLTGNGVGGRNQELALRFSREAFRNNLQNVTFLSAGTDGIDGPTNAAGAVGHYDLAKDVGVEVLDDFIERNDSFNFYSKFKGDWHVICGHTGTNVMDLHLIAIEME